MAADSGLRKTQRLQLLQRLQVLETCARDRCVREAKLSEQRLNRSRYLKPSLVILSCTYLSSSSRARAQGARAGIRTFVKERSRMRMGRPPTFSNSASPTSARIRKERPHRSRVDVLQAARRDFRNPSTPATGVASIPSGIPGRRRDLGRTETEFLELFDVLRYCRPASVILFCRDQACGAASVRPGAGCRRP